MPEESTLTVLRALARGVDPATGEALPADHLCQQGATVRALCAALAELESMSRRPAPARRAAQATGKAGLPWHPEEDELLVCAFDAGSTLTEIAHQMLRSRGAIQARLVRLGKLEAPPGYRFAGTSGAAAPRSATAPDGEVG